ncbi:MAG TPA: CHAD domain-containing protein [Dongiaceae bacterium]|nr:CHAD domain-containing protein [Dongiaceae bacterium]
MTDEIELKLRLPDHIDGKKVSFTPAKIAAAFGVAEGIPKRSQQLVSTYFDTEDEWLRQHGMALRIRQAGRQRIQTLKAPAGEVAGAQSYLEIESAIAADRPDLSLVGDQQLLDQLVAAQIETRLRPVFTTEFRRTAWLLDFEGCQIELAFDRGRIVVGAQEVPIHEVELELKSGKPAVLFSLAESVLDKIPVSLGLETKAARGYRLQSGQQAGAVKATPIDLPEGCDVGEAFSSVMAQYMALLRANEQAVIGSEDPEGIHQFRVTLRRLRSLVRAYRDLMDELSYRHLADELRWLQSQFGPARDLDVFIGETMAPIRKRFAELPALTALIEIAGQRRQSARHQAHLTLQTARYVRLQLMIYRWLATGAWRRASATASLGGSAVDFAGRLLKKQHKKMRRLGQDGVVPEAQLHELRVLGKQMRYLGDAFRSLYKAKPVRKYHLHLTAIQDCLGALNDAFVADRMIGELISQLPESNGLTSDELAHLRGIVAGWQGSRIEAGLSRFGRQWRDFKKADAYWKHD